MTVNNPSQDTWSAQNYNKTASFVYSHAFTAPVLDLLHAKPGERIIDFGCGSGEVTLELLKVVGEEGLVVGVDSSKSMVSKFLFMRDFLGLLFPTRSNKPARTASRTASSVMYRLSNSRLTSRTRGEHSTTPCSQTLLYTGASVTQPALFRARHAY